MTRLGADQALSRVGGGQARTLCARRRQGRAKRTSRPWSATPPRSRSRLSSMPVSGGDPEAALAELQRLATAGTDSLVGAGGARPALHPVASRGRGASARAVA